MNVSSSFLMEVLTELMLQRFSPAMECRAAILVGFLEGWHFPCYLERGRYSGSIERKNQAPSAQKSLAGGAAAFGLCGEGEDHSQ
jgi:hypothetical protein